MTPPNSDSLIRLMAPSGFLRSYIDYASDLTDAPRIFHVASGLAGLSAAVGNAIVYRGLGGAMHHPNIFVLELAPSGIGRKSTSVNLIGDLLGEMNPEIFLPNEFSRERLVMSLERHPAAILKIPEFSTLLTAMNRSYMEGTKEFITDMYDYHSQYIRETLKDGKKTIRDPAITILGASTPEWVIENLKPEDLRGGFMGRFMMVLGRQRGPDRGLGKWQSTEIRRALVTWLAAINTMPPATVDFGSVTPIFNDWLRTTQGKAEIREATPEFLGFVGRIGAHALKLCALFQVSLDGPQRAYTIGNSAFQSAITFVSEVLLDDLRELMETKLVFSKQERQMQNLLERISMNGGIDRTVLLKNSHLTTVEFDRILATLKDRGEVVEDRVSRSGRPRRMYHRAGPGQQDSEPAADLTPIEADPEWLRS